MEINCPICNIKNIDKKHPYSVHKIKYADFIELHYPRHDLWTKEPIKFKSEDSYFLTDFNDKRNLKKYLESVSKEDGINCLKEWLLRRKEIKDLIYAPSEFELKSLCYPSISFFHKFYGKDSYENICKELKLILKYNYNKEINFNNVPEFIVCDTREKSPYIKLELSIEIQCLNFADYTTIPNNENVFYERKEISDWAGVMSKGYSRFEKEIQRAKDKNAYIIVLIEGEYCDLQSINYLPQTKWIKASSEYLLKHARDLYLKFDNFQMVAGGNRNNCIKLFNKLVKIKDIKDYDIQYLINTKSL